MAAGVAITISPWLLLREAWSDLGGHALSDDQYEGVVAQCTTASTSVTAWQADAVGGGFWRITSPGSFNGLILTSALEDDQFYLLSPDGTVRQFAVVRTAAAMDAPAGNETTTLTDADGDFLGEDLPSPPVVMEGDWVVLPSTGAMGRILTVTTDTLVTSGLSLHQVFSAGRNYLVVRSTESDARGSLDLTGRRLDWNLAQRMVGEKLLQQLSTQRAVGMGGSTSSPPELAAIRQRLCELRGVRGR